MNSNSLVFLLSNFKNSIKMTTGGNLPAPLPITSLRPQTVVLFLSEISPSLFNMHIPFQWIYQ